MKDKKQTVESFLKSEFFDPNQKQTSSESKIVKNYELNAPYSYANILYNEKNSSYEYQVDEIKLNQFSCFMLISDTSSTENIL